MPGCGSCSNAFPGNFYGNYGQNTNYGSYGGNACNPCNLCAPVCCIRKVRSKGVCRKRLAKSASPKCYGKIEFTCKKKDSCKNQYSYSYKPEYKYGYSKKNSSKSCGCN